MGLGRMIQGGHFASDVLWSAGFIYIGGLILDRIILGQKEN
jgi:membrane-associated PAP2 superfamily phosphatase